MPMHACAGIAWVSFSVHVHVQVVLNRSPCYGWVVPTPVSYYTEHTILMTYVRSINQIAANAPLD